MKAYPRIQRAILEAISTGISNERLIFFVSGVLSPSNPGSFYETDEKNVVKKANYILDFISRYSEDFNKKSENQAGIEACLLRPIAGGQV